MPDQLFDLLEKSIVLVTSTDAEINYFGTGFVVHKEANNEYLIITCAHVVRDVGKDTIKIGVAEQVTVEAIGNADGADDLAILRVSGKELHYDHRLTIGQKIIEKDIEFSTYGFQRYEIEGVKGNHQAKLVGGKLGKRTIIENRSGKKAKAWDIHITDSIDSLQEGYSGAPIANKNGEVIGVISTKTSDGKKGVAISIEVLKKICIDIWNKITQPHKTTTNFHNEQETKQSQPTSVPESSDYFSKLFQGYEYDLLFFCYDKPQIQNCYHYSDTTSIDIERLARCINDQGLLLDLFRELNRYDKLDLTQQINSLHLIPNSDYPLIIAELSQAGQQSLLFAINLIDFKDAWLYPLTTKLASNVVQLGNNIAFCCKDDCFYIIESKTGTRINHEPLKKKCRRYFLSTDEAKETCFIVGDRLYKFQDENLTEEPFPTPDAAVLKASTPVLTKHNLIIFGTRNTKTKDSYLLKWDICKNKFSHQIFASSKLRCINPAPNNKIVITRESILDEERYTELYDIYDKTKRASIRTRDYFCITVNEYIYHVTHNHELIIYNTKTLRQENKFDLPIEIDSTTPLVLSDKYLYLSTKTDQIIIFDTKGVRITTVLNLKSDQKLKLFTVHSQFLYLCSDSNIEKIRLKKTL